MVSRLIAIFLYRKLESVKIVARPKFDDDETYLTNCKKLLHLKTLESRLSENLELPLLITAQTEGGPLDVNQVHSGEYFLKQLIAII